MNVSKASLKESKLARPQGGEEKFTGGKREDQRVCSAKKNDGSSYISWGFRGESAETGLGRKKFRQTKRKEERAPKNSGTGQR